MAKKIVKRPGRVGSNISDAPAKIIYGILIAFIIIQPLIFLTFLNNFWDLSKSAVLYFTALAMFVVFVFSTLSAGKFEWRRTPLDRVIPITLLVMTVMTIFSSDIARSVFGEYRRYEGLVTYFSYAVIFYGAAFSIRTRKQVETILSVWMIPVALASIYGIMQHFGHDFFQFSSNSFEINRSFGTMGNPIKFGTFLAIAAPILAYLYLRSKSQVIQVLAFGTLMLDVVANYFTFSRAGWISMVAALVVFIIVAPKGVLKKKIAPVIVLGVALFGIVFFVNSLKSTLPGYDLGSRISSISQTETGSNAARLNVWSSSLKMSAEKPIAGFGLDTYRMNFPRFRQASQLTVESGVIEYDRPHNDSLQILTAVGFPGLVFYFFMIFIPFLMVLRYGFKLDEDKRMIVAAGAGGIIAHIISVQFSFTNVVLFSEFMILSAIIFFITSDKKPSVIELKSLANSESPLRIAAIVGAIAIVALSMFQFVRMPAADFYYKEAQQYGASGVLDRAIQSMETSIGLFPHEPFYQNTLGQMYIQSYQQALQQNASADPSVISNALELYKAQIIAHPWEKMAYMGLAQLYLNMGDNDNAILTGKQAAIIDPYAFDALLTVAFALDQKGQSEEALQYYERSLLTIPPPQNEIFVRKTMVNTYLKSGKVDKVMEQLTAVLKINSTDVEALQQLEQLEGAAEQATTEAAPVSP